MNTLEALGVDELLQLLKTATGTLRHIIIPMLGLMGIPI